jgi:hypothetical protein
MPNGIHEGLSIHQASLISLVAAISGACLGYCVCQFASRAKPIVRREVYQIQAEQLGTCTSKEERARPASSQKADPYDPLPRQGWAPNSLFLP